MFAMHRIISISLSVLLAMSLCTWSTSKAYNVRVSNYNQQQNQQQQVSNGHYRKYNPDYDDWLFYVHDDDEISAANESPRNMRRRRRRRGIYETLSNLTRTSFYNLFNWGKSSFVTASSKNYVLDGSSTTTEKPSIPRVNFRKIVEYMPTLEENCHKCISSDRNHHQVSTLTNAVRNRSSIYTDTFRRNHRTEDSLLPFFSHDPSKPDGPEYWEDAAPSCGGNFQSPIALNSRDAVSVRYRSLTINNIDSVPTSIKLQNDGHSVKYTPTYANGEQVTISGGPLADEYVLHHFHFHWGSTNDKGSEHYLNGRQFASEIHLVHYNKKYRSFDDAAAQPQGLAVIGFFYQISSRLQDSFLDQGLDSVINPNDTTTLSEEDTYSISDIIGDTPFEFISYAGSLTTPPCYETVTWIVGTEILEMSETEIEAFRQLRDSSNSQMVDNFRPLQKRNGRKLFLFHDDL